jgi:hypothetical protein
MKFMMREVRKTIQKIAGKKKNNSKKLSIEGLTSSFFSEAVM